MMCLIFISKSSNGSSNKKFDARHNSQMVQTTRAEECKRVLGSFVLKKSDSLPEFHKVINHMVTIDEFEEAWKYLVEKYNLKNYTYMK